MKLTRPLRPLTAAALVAMIAGCGSSAPTAATTQSGQGQPAAAVYRFSACMRAHGVTNFPDPKVTISPDHTSTRVAMMAPKGSPKATAALAACNKLLPGPTPTSPAQQRSQTAGLMALARCLRVHGFPRFPDPTASGQLPIEMIQAAHINVHTPAFLPAAQACTSATHGQITRAQVAAAVNHH
jgi:hypothetical protein